MLNSFETCNRSRVAVGCARFAFRFLAILASLEDGRPKAETYGRGQLTTVTDVA